MAIHVPVETDLLPVFELERLEEDLFRGFDHPTTPADQRLFGGQVAAQALRAAAETVRAEHRPHSLHGYFLRAGRPHTPIVLRVERVRDGRSFSTRHVAAVQGGETIFNLIASFHRDEEGGEFAMPMAPGVSPPSDAEAEAAAGTATEHPDWRLNRPVLRKELEIPPDEPTEATRRMWVRSGQRLPDDPVIHACALTYMSDLGAVTAAIRALPGEPETAMAGSLDHSLWFHRPARADEWLLFDVRPVSVHGARGLVSGTLHTAGGVHVASMTQEAFIRLR